MPDLDPTKFITQLLTNNKVHWLFDESLKKKYIKELSTQLSITEDRIMAIINQNNRNHKPIDKNNSSINIDLIRNVFKTSLDDLNITRLPLLSFNNNEYMFANSTEQLKHLHRTADFNINNINGQVATLLHIASNFNKNRYFESCICLTSHLVRFYIEFVIQFFGSALKGNILFSSLKNFSTAQIAPIFHFLPVLTNRLAFFTISTNRDFIKNYDDIVKSSANHIADSLLTLRSFQLKNSDFLKKISAFNSISCFSLRLEAILSDFHKTEVQRWTEKRKKFDLFLKNVMVKLVPSAQTSSQIRFSLNFLEGCLKEADKITNTKRKNYFKRKVMYNKCYLLVKSLNFSECFRLLYNMTEKDEIFLKKIFKVLTVFAEDFSDAKDVLLDLSKTILKMSWKSKSFVRPKEAIRDCIQIHLKAVRVKFAADSLSELLPFCPSSDHLIKLIFHFFHLSRKEKLLRIDEKSLSVFMIKALSLIISKIYHKNSFNYSVYEKLAFCCEIVAKSCEIAFPEMTYHLILCAFVLRPKLDCLQWAYRVWTQIISSNESISSFEAFVENNFHASDSILNPTSKNHFPSPSKLPPPPPLRLSTDSTLEQRNDKNIPKLNKNNQKFDKVCRKGNHISKKSTHSHRFLSCCSALCLQLQKLCKKQSFSLLGSLNILNWSKLASFLLSISTLTPLLCTHVCLLGRNYEEAVRRVNIIINCILPPELTNLKLGFPTISSRQAYECVSAAFANSELVRREKKFCYNAALTLARNVLRFCSGKFGIYSTPLNRLDKAHVVIVEDAVKIMRFLAAEQVEEDMEIEEQRNTSAGSKKTEKKAQKKISFKKHIDVDDFFVDVEEVKILMRHVADPSVTKRFNWRLEGIVRGDF